MTYSDEEYNKLMGEYDNLYSEKDNLKAVCHKLMAEVDRLKRLLKFNGVEF